jgi:hypothetical protein
MSAQFTTGDGVSYVANAILNAEGIPVMVCGQPGLSYHDECKMAQEVAARLNSQAELLAALQAMWDVAMPTRKKETMKAYDMARAALALCGGGK